MSTEKGDATERTPQPESTPAPAPQLTADEKFNLLILQRSALMAENKKIQADHLFAATMQQLNDAYQATMRQYGCQLNENTLELIVPAEK